MGFNESFYILVLQIRVMDKELRRWCNSHEKKIVEPIKIVLNEVKWTL